MQKFSFISLTKWWIWFGIVLQFSNCCGETKCNTFFSKLILFSFAEIERVQKGEPKKDSETYLDLYTAKNVRVKERVLIPVKQYPRVSSYTLSEFCMYIARACCWLTNQFSVPPHSSILWERFWGHRAAPSNVCRRTPVRRSQCWAKDP